MQIISKRDAKAKGLKFYYTGRPCKRGHDSVRQVSNETCYECSKLSIKKYQSENRDKINKYRRDCYAKDSLSVLAANRRWQENNWERYCETKRKTKAAYYHKRYKTDSEYVLDRRMRNMLARQVRQFGSKKESPTCEALGYTPNDLKRHLERQFSKGMTWGNYGQWHIDHIIPVAEMIRSGEKDPSVIHCLTNLRPMWADENMLKSDKRTTLL